FTFKEAPIYWERGRAGSPAGQPRWGARLVRIERAARKNQSLIVFSGLVKTSRLRRDADGASALPVISGIEPIQLSTALVRQSLNSYNWRQPDEAFALKSHRKPKPVCPVVFIPAADNDDGAISLCDEGAQIQRPLHHLRRPAPRIGQLRQSDRKDAEH